MNPASATASIYDIPVRTISGETINFEKYRGSVLLIVNVASQCVFTSQYAQLQSLFDLYESLGLVVMGFPCNQFGGQESKDDASIKQFCTLNYKVTFPMFSKIEVNGPGTHPLFALLKSNSKGIFGSESIKWNFTKFLVGRNGSVLGRYSPTTSPKSLNRAIEKELAKVHS